MATCYQDHLKNHFHENLLHQFQSLELLTTPCAGEISYEQTLYMGLVSIPSYEHGNGKLSWKVYYLNGDNTSTPALFCFMGEMK